MSYDISDSDREEWAGLLESRRKMGSRKPTEDDERVTLGDTDFGPEKEVVVSSSRWALDKIFHLSEDCYHLQDDTHHPKEVRQLQDDYTLCWHCEKARYDQ